MSGDMPGKGIIKCIVAYTGCSRESETPNFHLMMMIWALGRLRLVDHVAPITSE